jgi:glycosyltransferase involved in cell wall biosynthesis
MKTKLSIIIPAYRAEKYIARTLADYLNYYSSFQNLGFELIVVTSGDSDRTSKIVNGYKRKYPYSIKHKNCNGCLGKGIAIVTGFKMARGDILAFVDADESTSPEEMYRIINKLKNCDGVIASRWLPGSRVVVKQPLVRRIASRGFNLLVRLLFGLKFKDTQCGAKVFKKSAIDKIIGELKTTGFVFDVELLHKLKKHGFVVREVQTTWVDRDTSTVHLIRALPNVLWSLLSLRVSKA